MKLKLALCLSLVGGLFTLGTPLAQTDPPPLFTVRVGKIGPFTLDEKSPSWTIEVGQEQGFFQQEGLDVQLVLTSGFEPQMEGLIGGDFEIGHQSTTQLIAEVERGASLFMFMGDRRGPLFTLVATPAIRSVEQLRGQLLGTSGTTGTDHLPLIRMLSAFGLRPQDYTIAPSGNVLSRYQLLEQEVIAASLLSGELVERAMRSGLTNLGEADHYLSEFAFSAAATRRDWARAHPDRLRAYVRAYLRSVEWLRNPSHRSEAIFFMRVRAGLDEKAAEEIYQATIARLVPSGELKLEGIRAVVETMVQAHLIQPGPHPLDRYLDLSYLQSAREVPAEK